MIQLAPLLFATALSQTPPPDGLLQDGFDAGSSCPAVVSTPTGNVTLRGRSDIWYLPGVRIRHNVDVTAWDNVWGHIDELDGLTLWPGVPGASPTIHTVGRTEYVAAKFHVPALALPTLTGTFVHVSYGGGPNIDMTISRTCGDFRTVEQGCWVHDDPGDDAPMLRWRLGAGNRFYCHLDPDTDYFVNMRFTDPHATGPDCSGASCQMTVQQFIGGF